jgi:hypothetical protein
MSFFAVYDLATGAIKRYGSCGGGDLARQAQAGEAVIATPAPAPDNKFKIDITKTPPAPVATS